LALVSLGSVLQLGLAISAPFKNTGVKFRQSRQASNQHATTCQKAGTELSSGTFRAAIKPIILLKTGLGDGAQHRLSAHN